MKKFLYIILISLFSLSIISCEKKDSSSGSSTINPVSSVTLKMSTFVVNTKLESGTDNESGADNECGADNQCGTIRGSVLSQSNLFALSGVSVNYTKSGETIVNTSTDSNGGFSQALPLGTYTLNYSKSGYLDETQSATLATDNQTLVVSTLRMLSESCSTGTISGTIKDAVKNDPVTGVSLSARRGLNMTSGTVAKTGTTPDNGSYSLSSMTAGWYTIETTKSGYITSTFHVYACGDQSGQDAFISPTLAPGAMRIVLTWKTDTDDLDSHLTAPDNLSGQGHSNAVNQQFHLYYQDNNFYYATNNFSCSGCSADQMSDNVTLDLDNTKGIGSCNSCGPETLTISAVRGGTYHYYVHNYDEAGKNNLKLAASEASVNAYYNDTVTTFNVPNSAADLWHVFDFDNTTGFTAINNMGSDSSFSGDVFAPNLTEVTAVTTRTNVTTPNYTFSSNEAGTIVYGGSCSSSDTSANVDNNTIAFRKLGGGVLDEGTYSNCTIRVTDSASNTSDNLSVSTFTIDTTDPLLTQVTAVPSPSRDNTSSYTFTTNEAGTISYSGGCSSSDNTTALADDNITITFNELADNTYDCSVIVTDNASNQGTISVEFIIDTTAPTLDNVTDVSTPTDNNTPNYTFRSSEAGTITYGGSCGSLSSSTVTDNTSKTITLTQPDNSTPFSDGTYSNCTVRVTDPAGNVSDALDVTPFTVAVPPLLEEVTAVPTPTDNNTPSYTFSSNEAGTISYGGACGSSTSSTATSDNNTVTLTQPDNSTPLSDGTYDNCTIRVTDNSSNTSSPLTVSSFTVGAFKPALAQVTAVPTPTDNITPSYTFFSTLPGLIIYSGDCNSSDNSSDADNNTITFNALSEGPHTNCKISVTSSDNLTSDNLSVDNFTIDITAPLVDNFTMTDTQIKVGETATVQLVFSEAVISFSSTADITVPNGSLSTMTSSDNKTWSGTFTPATNAEDPTNTLSLATSYTDTAGNNGPAATTANYEVENRAPSANSFTMSDTQLKIGETATVQLVFSEAVIGFSSTADITVYNGSLSTMTSDDDNITWSGTFTPETNAEVANKRLSLATTYTDLAGNNGSAKTTPYYKVDTKKPTLSVVTAVSNPTDNNTPSYTFGSSETGTISYGGACGSSTSSAVTSTYKTVTLTQPDNSTALNDGTTYSDCKITVTDASGNASDALDVASFTVAIPPVLKEVTAVPTPTDNNTPNYTFSSTEAGTITYGGACGSSAPSAATSGDNTVTLTMPDNSTLDDGTYDNCTIRVTDNVSNTSSPLTVSSFAIGHDTPALAQVTAVPTPTDNSTPSYTFFSTLSGTINYSGDCSSSDNSSDADNNTITFNALSEGPHTNCKISVTSSASGYTSDNLSVDNFTIDTTAPILTPITLVPSLTNVNTPSYTFRSNEAGTITYGDCISSTTAAYDADNNTITFNALGDGQHATCTITVRDNAGNTRTLDVDPFTIDTTKPILNPVSAVPTPTDNSTPSYTFFSTEAGVITYSGGCGSSSPSAAASGNNAVRLTQSDNSTALSDDTYNCTIRVTDNASNTSNPLQVTQFVIDTTGPIVEVVTPVANPGNDTTPRYIFRSNEAGTIVYGGSCISSDTSANVDNNTIDFNTLSVGSYDGCTIRVTDNASNQSNRLDVNIFVIEITPPTVSSIYPTDNLSGISISTDNISVTFSESMDNNSVTANTSSTSCTGSFQLSPDNFSSCVQMSSSPSSSDNTTFEFAPSLTLFYSTNYKIRIKTAASDIAGNTMASDNTTANGFNTTDIVPITSGYAHNCFMLDNGSVKCWGANASGQLGLGHTNNRGDNSSLMGDNLLAVDLGTGKTVRAIEAGDNHTCAILDNESVKCWGANASGQLGLGHTNNRGDNSSLMGDNLLAVDLGSDRTAKAIAAGYAHTCAILDNSLVKCWGSNTSGQLGLGDTDSRGDNASEMGGSLTTVDLGTTAKAISAGDSHTCAILDNSQVKCWGDNTYGQLGQGDNINRGYGSNQMGSLNPVNLGSERTAKSITTGTGYTCVILDDDSVKCWGRGHAGQLAHGKTQPVDSPPNLPINLGSGITAKAITAGKFHTCAVIDNSSIKCWGLNDSGQLGLENTSNRGDEQNEMGDNLPAVDLGAGKTARAISTGDSHTCAILDNSSIKCWGANASGQLGLGHTNNRGGNSSEMGDNLNVISL